MSSRIAVSYLAFAVATNLVAPGILAAAETIPDTRLPAVSYPPDNPSSAAKIVLGKQLFFDVRLSRTNRVSCAKCHDPTKGWSDGRPLAVGVDGKQGTRNSPTLINVAYNRFHFWDGRAASLEQQALHPIQNPVEMDLSLDQLVEKLNGIPDYRRQFQSVFRSDASPETFAMAIAAYERTIVSCDAPADRFAQGDTTAMTPAAQRGGRLFFGEARCHVCHSGPNFTDDQFHNIGIAMGPESLDTGRQQVTGREEHRGAFKTPTLREIARTAPYMHDGSLKTIEEVVRHYNFGGVTDAENEYRDQELQVLYLSDAQVADLVAFLEEGLSSDSYPQHEPPPLSADEKLTVNAKDDGYRGIWYMNQPSGDEYVYKYSGGLGTYCAKHKPFAVHAPEVEKTFFCYGGTTKDSNRRLIHMVSYFDHRTRTVPRPTILLDKKTDDAHDNPVISLDGRGHVWIFSTSHGRSRPSYIHRSKLPYSIDEFEQVAAVRRDDGRKIPITNFSYMQVWHQDQHGFLCFFTRYDDPAKRTTFFMQSRDGVTWDRWQRLAAIDEGHYQISAVGKAIAGTAFNYHPKGKGLNWRTNLYYLDTRDGGRTWQTADGQPIEVPLTQVANDALVHDYQRESLNVYLKDIRYDDQDHPIILFLTSKGYQSGPENSPRTWTTARWTGNEWDIRPAFTSDNNYDMGSLFVESDGALADHRPQRSRSAAVQSRRRSGHVAKRGPWNHVDEGQAANTQQRLEPHVCAKARKSPSRLLRFLGGRSRTAAIAIFIVLLRSRGKRSPTTTCDASGPGSPSTCKHREGPLADHT